MTSERKLAFKCMNCGHLETSGNAGERDYPAACTTCGAGVSFDPATGIKEYADDKNWIVLADLPAAETEGIKVEKHKPAPAAEVTREPQNIERSTEDGLGAEDKVS